MQARLEFSRKHYKTPWRRYLFTDSSIFYLKPSRSSKALKYWGVAGSHTIQTYTRDARKVHVYGGVSEFGLTPLFFVTGTTGMKSEFKNKKGEPYRGVCAAEYQKLLKEHFVREGDKLFKRSGKWADCWIFQQDGASSHTSPGTKKVLKQLMGADRVLEGWPANSPDLSWIENIWALVDKYLRREEFKDLDDFKAAIVRIWSGIKISTLQKCVRGMPNRFRKCIANNGGHIGK